MGKELKSLSRKELVDIIYEMKKRELELQEENERLRSRLESRRIAISEAGSLAEAAVALTNLLSTAQAAADIYLAEIKHRYEEMGASEHEE